MSLVVVAGVVITLAGVAMLIWCVISARRLKSAPQGEAETKAALQKLIALNMGGVFTGFIGLAVVIAGGLFS